MEETNNRTDQEKKFFAIENIFKGLVTSLLGLVFMGMAAYGWWNDHLTDLQGGAALLIGFVLAFMRDKLPDFIGRWFNKKLGRDEDGTPTPK